MNEAQPEDEFEKLLLRTAPSIAPGPLSQRLLKRRLKGPVELEVFQKIGPQTQFTWQQWLEWYHAILHAVGTFGPKGFHFPFPLLDIDLTAVDGLPLSDDPFPPLARMLAQFEISGMVKRCGSSFVVTEKGWNLLQSDPQHEEE